MFQIKNFNSIVASMENNVSALSDDLTDFNIGSKNRTLLEACAREIEQFYEMLLEGLTEAIPVAIFKSFSFGKKTATPSSGYVTFTRDSSVTGDISIPSGTQLIAPNTDLTFTTSSAATLASGSTTVDVLVVCVTTGTVGNVVSGTISSLSGMILGIANVTNKKMFINGTDDETYAERKLRFQKYIKNLARAIRTAIEYGAESVTITNSDGWVTEQVVDALVHEPCIDDTPAGNPGYVDVYLWNGVDGASNALIAKTKKVLMGYTDDDGNIVPGWKAAGVVARVYSVSLHVVNIAGTIKIASSGYSFSDVQTAAVSVVDTYIASLGIGDVFRKSELVKLLMTVLGVVDVTITVPSDNSTPGWNAICTKGTCTFTQQS